MTRKILPFAIALIAFFFSACIQNQKVVHVDVIPRPHAYWVLDKGMTFNSKVKVVIESDQDDFRKNGEYLAEILRNLTGFDVPVVLYDDAREIDKDILLLNTVFDSLSNGGYELNIQSGSARILSNTGAGFFYGIQSFLQLLPTEILTGTVSGEIRKVSLPGVKIRDKARFNYRGMHLDVSRHFFSKEFVLKFIDLMAFYKLNTFHWHLTDDNGWRLEIKKYPELTEICAWRADRSGQDWAGREPLQAGEKATYGGFYTQEDVKEVIAYAKERYITVIPEIEMPGHTSEIFAAYPELSCTGKKLNVNPGSYWPNTDIFCAGKEETFEFIENVLDEVVELFPSEYIHIGGDEADKTQWEKCPRCQAKIRKEDLKNEHELQSYFIKRIEKYLLSKGRKMIGWDEILEGGLAPEATVMSWRGMQGGIDAAKQGHDVIMTPTSHCYFDYYQADSDFEPLAIGGFTSLKKVYSFEPIPTELSEEEGAHILGAQANIWTEYISSPEHAEYMSVPRMIALAEVVWSPAKKRNWDHFNRRLQTHFKILDSKSVKYSKGSYKVDIISEADTSAKYNVKLESEIWNAVIHYTTDGSEPDTNALLYNNKFSIDKSTTIKAGVFVDGKLKEKASVQTILLHKALGKKIELKHKYSNQYTGGHANALIDGILAGEKHSNGLWQGFHGDDLEAVIDLEELTEFSHLEASFYQRQSSWIFFPEYVEFYVSTDGNKFKKVGRIQTDISLKDKISQRKEYIIASREIYNARYVKVIAKNIGICPDWHEGAGTKAWIFADEITIE